ALHLRRICSNDEDFEKGCIDLFDWLILTTPFNSEAYGYKAYCLFQNGNPNEAYTYVNQALSLDKKNSFAHWVKSILEINLGNNDKGCKNLSLAQKYGFKERYGTKITGLLSIKSIKANYCN
ncbi:MAG: tetratricopeptide repeat protein, partial [Psychroserpens sp.]|nr:tetratricopeptide repeat protein [Psychroserpens sp.]